MTDSTWPLVWIAEVAGISRGVARGLVRDGLLPAKDLVPTDAVVAKVGAACAALPAEDPDRDAQAIAMTRAIIKDERRTETVTLVLTEHAVTLVLSPADLVGAIGRYSDSVVIVAPVGAWLARLDERVAKVLAQRRRVPPTAAPSAGPSAVPSSDPAELPVVDDVELDDVAKVPTTAHSTGVHKDADGTSWMVFEDLLAPSGADAPMARNLYRVPLTPVPVKGRR